MPPPLLHVRDKEIDTGDQSSKDYTSTMINKEDGDGRQTKRRDKKRNLSEEERPPFADKIWRDKSGTSSLINVINPQSMSL
eukprot:10641504-Ditylum_brightwellii.AAC.1